MTWASSLSGFRSSAIFSVQSHRSTGGSVQSQRRTVPVAFGMTLVIYK